MSELILSKGTCCECQYNKCNQERERARSPFLDFMFFSALIAAIYLGGPYLLEKLEKGGGQ